jgi:hypothetical protein
VPADDVTFTTVQEGVVERERKLRWWKEALIIVGFYAIYSFVRNFFGSAQVDTEAHEYPVHAFTNAVRLVDWERRVGLFHEETVQEMFLSKPVFMQFWNTFYGTAHFFVTIAVFVLLFRFRPKHFTRWRNTLAFTTALALVGFSLFPLMPPRLLDEPMYERDPTTGEELVGWGGLELRLARDMDGFGFVDTLELFGGPWSFDSGAVQEISNQYAAMPSLHIAWSTWCVFAMWPLVRRRWLRVALFIYPAMTLFCIVVTANHYWIDGVGGQLVFIVGFALGAGLDALHNRRLDRRHAAALATGLSSQPSEPVEVAAPRRADDAADDGAERTTPV